MISNSIFFLFTCYGMTQILVFGTIFNKIRPKHIFFNCPMCVGFHVGIVVYFLFLVSGIDLFPNKYIAWFLCACASSGTSYFLCQLVDDDGLRVGKERKREKNDGA